ncbi:MAG: Smr/MutS family protein [Candidatus Aegiribacteria sp.]
MTGPLKSLEFGKVLEDIASRVRSGSGREAVTSAFPCWEPAGAVRLADETLAAADLLDRGIRVPAGGNDELLRICSLLEDGALVLEPGQLRTVGVVLEELGEFLADAEAEGEDDAGEGPLDRYFQLVPGLPELSGHLVSITTPEGELSPSASRELARLMKKVDSLKRKLSGRIDGLYSTLSRSGVLRDMPPTLRDGRYVLPVISSRRGEVRGIVHDRSESGETIFIEPAGLVEDGNALREATLDLEYEKRRILRDATLELRKHLPRLKEGGRAVAELDAVFARAEYHLEMRTVFPDRGNLSLEDLRHPLIPPGEVVGNTVQLPGDWRVLIVSGPNAGGKSVLLKAVGLAVACAQSGIGACVSSSSTMPFFGMLHVSIGDQQSIAEHQSTYSARLLEQLRMLSSPGPGSLALIDEPAAGTDPLTGAALAASVLEQLAGTGCRVIVTTHQGQLKSLAQGREGFYNGSMNFRVDTLEPDYTYVPEIPGSSFTLEIARRIGFPEGVLSRALRLSGDSFRLDRMLEDVSSKRRELASRIGELEEREEESRKLLARKGGELEREREELNARREELEEEYSRLLNSINSRADSLLARLARSESPEDRRELREKLRDITSNAAKVETEPDVDEEFTDGNIEPGDWVSVKGWSGCGRVEETGRDYVAVIMGNLRLRKPPGEVTRVPPPRAKPSTAGWSAPVEAETELDLRGMSAEEALAEVDRAIEDGLVAGIPFIRVIHGKGKGILMRAVVDMVRTDGRVDDFRPGKPPEGGTGVTVVYLKTGGDRG